MDFALNERLVARICSGSSRAAVSGPGGRERYFFLRRPTREHVYAASEIYADALADAQFEGLYSDPDLLDFLLSHGFWDETREKNLELLPKQMEESKVSLYRSTFKSNERKVIRKALAAAKREYARLYEERHSYDHLSCSGYAGMVRARYLVWAGLHSADGKRVFAEYDDAPVELIDEVMVDLAENRIEESAYRELCRTEPWRAIWNGTRVERSLFGVPPPDWTDEQKNIVNWSLLYDNVFQHPDCPPEAVIEDDDLLDGWLIVQRRDREQKLNAKDGEQLVGNEKIRDSQEVYLVADTVDDAKKVVELNDEYGKAVQKQRFNTLKKKGEVNELEMPDTALRLRTAVTAKLSASMSRKG